MLELTKQHAGIAEMAVWQEAGMAEMAVWQKAGIMAEMAV